MAYFHDYDDFGDRDRDHREIEEGRVPQDQPPGPAREPRPIRDVGLEIAQAAIDQVIADVGGAIGG